MSIYKIIFAKKSIVSCEPVKEKIAVEDKYVYQHQNGEPIYAFVKAESSFDALKIANELIEKLRNKLKGEHTLLKG